MPVSRMRQEPKAVKLEFDSGGRVFPHSLPLWHVGSSLPGGVGDDLQAARVPDQLVQEADYLVKLGTVVSVFLPAVKHQLIQGCRAVHRRGQAVALVHRLDHLRKQKCNRGL